MCCSGLRGDKPGAGACRAADSQCLQAAHVAADTHSMLQHTTCWHPRWPSAEQSQAPTPALHHCLTMQTTFTRVCRTLVVQSEAAEVVGAGPNSLFRPAAEAKLLRDELHTWLEIVQRVNCWCLALQVAAAPPAAARRPGKRKVDIFNSVIQMWLFMLVARVCHRERVRLGHRSLRGAWGRQNGMPQLWPPHSTHARCYSRALMQPAPASVLPWAAGGMAPKAAKLHLA